MIAFLKATSIGVGFFGIGLVLKVVIEAATLAGIEAGHCVDQAGHCGGLFRCQAATAAARVRMLLIVEACHVAFPSLVTIRHRSYSKT